MRAVIQRVKQAKVTVNGEITGEIASGILVLLGVSNDDTESDARFLVDKIVNLRIFNDTEGKMNLSLLDISGSLLVVSQFTLYADTRKGRRPSYIEAAPPQKANELYEYFVEESRKSISNVQTGRFQAMMDVELVNDGPVTIILESPSNKL
jgi:D-aminoacyl-tRNA deacylase